MDLRYWLAEALTGDVGPEVKLQGSPRFSSRFGGGDFAADIMLGHLRTRSGARDSAAINEVLSWTEGGKFTIVITHGNVCRGEWLIWKSSPVDSDAPISVSGFELDGYPAFRSLNANYQFTAADQLHIGSRLLRDAFYSHQDFAITIPWPTSGINRAVDYKSHTAYYSDVLEEITAPDDGFQWRVVHDVEWADARPVRVVRRVQFGQPELRRSSSLRMSMGGEDGRQGNLVRFPRPGRDFSKYAQSVYGFGRGEGAKQQWVGLSDPTLTNQGHLIVTKNITFPGATNTSALRSLTRGALEEAQNLQEPIRATVMADKVPAIPRVGDVIPVDVVANHAWPYGFEGDLHVGQVELRPSGNDLQSIDLLAI